MIKKGLLIVISGPSGAGKGTIYNAVLDRFPSIKKSISVTTRKPRPGEKDGVDYHFHSVEDYQQMIADGAFLETAAVYNNFYGTLKEPVFKMLEEGDDVMFEVDVNGAKQIKKQYPQCVCIFVMTPDFDVLKERLIARKTESESSIKTRLSAAKNELSKYKHFDYIVFNDDVIESVDAVSSIISAEKSRVSKNMEKIEALLKK